MSCDVITGTFNSGQPTTVTLSNLQTARGVLLLGSSVPCIAAPHVASSAGSQAYVTLYFAGNARGVQATIILFPEGTPQLTPGNLYATTTTPGIVAFDGTTITMSAAGVLSAGGGGGGGTRVTGEVPSGPTTTTYSNDTYTLAYTPLAGTLAVTVGGLRSAALNPTTGTAQWTLTGATLQFSQQFIPQPGDGVLVDYAH